jgi:asparagine synthase (glutamine-hydrolysing)
MLDGFDGDSTVSHGTGYLTELARSWNWMKLAPEIRGLSRNFKLSAWKMARDLAWQYNLGPMVPTTFKRMGRAVLRRTKHNRRASDNGLEAISILKADFASRIGLVERRMASQKSPALTEREVHFQTLSWPVAPYILEVLSKGGAAFFIEPRYPFFDKRLVEYCLSLPGEQKIRKGWTRMVMRNALRGMLPEEVRWRPGKTNMGLNFSHVFLAFERARIEDVVLYNPRGIEDYVNIDKIREAYSRVKAKTSAQCDLVTIWKVVTLALWLQQTRVSV